MDKSKFELNESRYAYKENSDSSHAPFTIQELIVLNEYGQHQLDRGEYGKH